MDEDQGQDPVQRYLASKPKTDPVAAYLASKSGPITPGHSKFTPAELQQHADRSVEDATQETKDAQDDLIGTLQTGAVAALEAPALMTEAAPTLLRGGVRIAKTIGSRLGTIRDVARLATGNPRPLVGRLMSSLAEGTAEKAAPFAGKAASVADAVAGVAPGASSIPRASVASLPLNREAAKQALEKMLGQSVEEGAVGESVKGYPIASDPPDNPELMQRIAESLRGRPRFRPTGGRSSPPSIADVLRARHSP